MKRRRIFLAAVVLSLLSLGTASGANEKMIDEITHDDQSRRLSEVARSISNLERRIDRLDERFERLDHDLKELKRKV